MQCLDLIWIFIQTNSTANIYINKLKKKTLGGNKLDFFFKQGYFYSGYLVILGNQFKSVIMKVFLHFN